MSLPFKGAAANGACPRRFLRMRGRPRVWEAKTHRAVSGFWSTFLSIRELSMGSRYEGFDKSYGTKGDMQMSSKRKVIAVVITTVALAVGSAGVSHADTTTKRITKKTVTTKSATTRAIKNVMGKGGNPAAQLATVLSGLVSKGTITQVQADAISSAITSAYATAQANRPVPADRAAKDAAITSVLGIDAATLKTRLQAGDSLATIAGTKKQALIDALVADETKRIDAAVTAGKLTAAQATTMKSGLVAHVTAEVESVRGPMGMGGKGGRHGGPMMGVPPTIPTPTGSAA